MQVQKYKVKALYLGGLFNKIFNSGDEVTADDFPTGNVASLVQNGFLMPMDPPEDTNILMQTNADGFPEVKLDETPQALTEATETPAEDVVDTPVVETPDVLTPETPEVEQNPAVVAPETITAPSVEVLTEEQCKALSFADLKAKAKLKVEAKGEKLKFNVGKKELYDILMNP